MVKTIIDIVYRSIFAPDETDQLILEALKERPKYTLELHDDTGKGLGSIYVALNKLEKLNLIGSYWDEVPRPERGGARRRYYYLKR